MRIAFRLAVLAVAFALTACPNDNPADQADASTCAKKCGTACCTAAQTCDEATKTCKDTCVPACTGKDCGSDGCGGTCGTCTDGKTCSAAGKCETTCVPACTGKTCGDNGCGGTCGTCEAGKFCDATSNCQAGCGTNTDCATVTGKPLCDTVTHACVACVLDTDCTGSVPQRCNPADKTCVGCLATSDCAAGNYCDQADKTCKAGCAVNEDCATVTGKPVCDAAAHACVACLSDANCGGATKKCDTAKATCVECLAKADCAAGSYCDTADNRCKAGCAANADCAGVTGKPVCDVANKTCVGCLDDASCTGTEKKCDTSVKMCVGCLATADCGAGNWCDTASKTCKAGCDADSGCTGVAGKPKCDVPAHACVACLADTHCTGADKKCDTTAKVCVGCLTTSDCAAGNYCDTAAKTCKPGCEADSGCATVAGKPKCDVPNKTCVACLDDTSCTGAAKKCDTTAKVCVACLATADCAATEYCDTAAKTCLTGCDADARCTEAAKPACKQASHTCVTCTADSFCTTSPAVKCDTATDACVECLAKADCGAGKFCHPVQQACLAGDCGADADCSGVAGKPKCDVAATTCVGCLANADCSGTTPVCGAAKSCVQCAANADCAAVAGKPVCDTANSVCEQCLAASDCGSGLCDAKVCTNADTCSPAAMLTLTAGAVSVTGNLTGAANDAQGSCGGDLAGDLVYGFTVTENSKVTATVTTTTTGFRPVVYLRPTCSAAADERACKAAAAGISTAAASATLLAGTYYVVVDAATATVGAFTLDLAVVPALPGDLCLTATALTGFDASGNGVVSLTAETLVGYANDFSGTSGNGCAGTSGVDHMYSVSLGAGKRLTAKVVQAAGSPLDPSINLVRGDVSACSGTPVCAASDDSGSAATQNVATVSNSSAAAQNIFVIVDSYTTGAAGTGEFNLEVLVEDLPVGDGCGNAEVLTAGTPRADQTTVGYTNDFKGGTGCPTGNSAADRVYSLEVPAGQRATVTATPGTGFDLSLSLIAGPASACLASPLACAAGTNAAGSAVAEVVAYVNNTTSPQTLFAVVDSATVAGGTFSIGFVLDTPPVDDRCQAATPLVAGTPLTGQTTVGYTNDYSGTATGCATANAGPDRVYVASVPPGTRGVFTLTADTGFDPSLSLVAGSAVSCDAPRVCAANNNTGGSGGVDTAKYFNTSASAVDVYAIVDSTVVAGGGFSIAFTTEVPPAGEKCQTAVALTPGTPLTGETTVGYANDFSGTGTNCSTANSGPDHVYSVVVPAGQRATFTVTPNTGFDTSVSLVGSSAAACDAASRVCLASANNGGSGAADTVRYFNADSSDLTVYAIVDSSVTAGGVYSIGVALDTPPAGDKCQTATALTAGTTLADQTTVGFANDYSGGTNCATASSGLDRVYSLAVPAGQRAIVTVTPAAGYDTSMSLLGGAASLCDAVPLVCTGYDNSGTAGNPDVGVWVNNGTSEATLFVIVDSTSTTGGTFSIGAVLEQATGDLCAGAEVIVPGTTPMPVTGTSSGFGNDYKGGTNCANPTSTTTGPDRLYQVTIPAGQRVKVTLTPTGWDASLSLIDGLANCAATPRVCVAGSDTSGVETAQYTNATATDATVFIAIDGYASTGFGPYSLNVVLDTPPPTVNPGDTCQLAPSLTPGVQIAGTLVGMLGTYGTGTNCSGTAGLDGVYAVVVPDGERLIATVTPTTSWDPSISLVRGPASNCDVAPRVCLVGSDSGGSGAPDTVRYLNQTGAAETVYVVVDTYSSSGTGGPFTLDTSVAAPPAGDACATAPAITLSGTSATLSNQTTVGFDKNYGSGTNCSGTSGADRVYSVVVPAGKRLAATVTPTGTSWNPSVNLVAGPASNCEVVPRVCLAGSDSAGSGLAESVFYNNATGTDATVFVVVGSGTSTATGTFDLSVSVDDQLPGEICTLAIALPGEVSRTGDTTIGYARDYGSGTGCTGTSNADRVYSLTIPATKRAVVTVTPTGTSWNPSINIVAGPASNCAVTPRVCLAGSDSASSGAAETVSYENSGAAPLDVFVIVGSGSGQGVFDLSVAFADPLTGEVCSSPVILPGATTLTGETTVGYASNYSGGSCSPIGTALSGPDKVYSVSVPAGSTLTATLTPVVGATGDAAIMLVQGPASNCTAAPTCLDGGDDYSGATAESASYTNSTASAVTVLIIVDAYGTTAISSYTLAVTLTP